MTPTNKLSASTPPSARGVEFQPVSVSAANPFAASPATNPAVPLITAEHHRADAQSASVETPSLAALTHVFVATFAIREPNTGKIHSEVVEVLHTQRPKADQDAAWKIIRVKYSQAGTDDIRRTAGRIVSRPGGKLPVIAVRVGETIRQLFPDRSEFEAARTVGTVIFEGALCDIILRHIRSKSVFAVTLRQPGGTVVNFSEQTTTTLLTDELPKILTETLGAASKTMTLYFQKVG